MTSFKKFLTHRIREISSNWDNWEWWKDRYRTRIFNPAFGIKGSYIMDKDWDNLIILDACRYDSFELIYKKFYKNKISGRLNYIYSKGSATSEFLEENFIKYPKKNKFNNTIYITANPFCENISEKFFKYYPVWDYGWNEKKQTVLPSTMVKESIEIENEYPNKALIIHFMQPHHPFVNSDIDIKTSFKDIINQVKNKKNNNKYIQPWEEAKLGNIKITEIKYHYIMNLKYVFMYIINLSNKLKGKTVVTSDHGNLFGERPHLLYPFKEYGHPLRLHVENLLKVPWFILDYEERKNIFEAKEKELISNSISKLDNISSSINF